MPLTSTGTPAQVVDAPRRVTRWANRNCFNRLTPRVRDADREVLRYSIPPGRPGTRRCESPCMGTNGHFGRSDRSAQRSGHQRRAVPRLVARYVAFLRPSCPCAPARSTAPSLDCGDPPSTAVIPLPLRSDLAPSGPVGILGGENHLATIRGLLPEHVCVLRTPSSFTSPNTLYSTLLPIEVL